MQCDYFSMLGFKLNHVSKRVPWWIITAKLFGHKISLTGEYFFTIFHVYLHRLSSRVGNTIQWSPLDEINISPIAFANFVYLDKNIWFSFHTQKFF